jgi:hypothetical protein
LKKFDYSFDTFKSNFTLEAQTLTQIQSFSEKQGILFDPNLLNSTQIQYIYTLMKSTMARLLWDNSEYYQCLNEMDPVLQSAVELFQNEKTASILENK